ncbi:hypothetical protein HUG17_8205 [Dermatophagoides farinae]|uniref:Uncharacterized protein n=1 Tax=Dermatophagoides farinae TaxID=6954 RepID=A0A9D4NXB2_DERFA|nr:hypothetical protein HUG17_8205 [Dermatophagoides farinae]
MINNKTESNQLCHSLAHSLKGQQHDNKSNILAVGLTRKNLLLITENYFVYELSIDSLDSNWKNTKNIFNAFIVIDNETDWLCLTTWFHITDEKGISYDLNNHVVKPGFIFTGNKREVLISTNKSCSYYALSYSLITNGLEIATYKCQKFITDSIKIVNQFRTICFTDGQEKEISIQNEYDENCKNYPVKWPIMKGFVADGRFYLFDMNNVHIFNEDFYTKNITVSVIQRKYSSFFVCPGSIPDSLTGKHSKILMIILAILLTFIGSKKHHKRSKSIDTSDVEQSKNESSILNKHTDTTTTSINTSTTTSNTAATYPLDSEFSRKKRKFYPWIRVKLMQPTRPSTFDGSLPKLVPTTRSSTFGGLLPKLVPTTRSSTFGGSLPKLMPTTRSSTFGSFWPKLLTKKIPKINVKHSNTMSMNGKILN